MQKPNQPTPTQRSHKLRWFLGLLGLLVLALLALQFREYKYWNNLASQDFNAQDKIFEEMHNRAIDELEKKIQQSQNAASAPGNPEPAAQTSPKQTRPQASPTPPATTPSPAPNPAQLPKTEPAPKPEPAAITAPAPAPAPPQETKTAVPAPRAAAVSYYPVTSAARNKTIDCDKVKTQVLRDKNLNADCINIYQKSESEAVAQAAQNQPARVILYGEYLMLDCFPKSEAFPNIISECYQAAKFMDRWQLQKTADVLRADMPVKPLYFFLAQTQEEAGRYCGGGNRLGCFVNSVDYSIMIMTAGLGQKGTLFDQGKTYGAKIYARYKTSDAAKITYSFTMVTPGDCLLIENHELLHVFNRQVYGTAPSWFEEGLVRLIQGPLKDRLCAPGDGYYNAVKTENGQTAGIENFDQNYAYRQEPLSTYLLQHSGDNQCRKGIYMQIARLLNEQGTAYLPKLYEALKGSRPASESAAATAVYISSGRSAPVRAFLMDNGCVIQ